MTDDPAGPVIDPPGSSRAEQPPPYQWMVAGIALVPAALRPGETRVGSPASRIGR